METEMKSYYTKPEIRLGDAEPGTYVFNLEAELCYIDDERCLHSFYVRSVRSPEEPVYPVTLETAHIMERMRVVWRKWSGESLMTASASRFLRDKLRRIMEIDPHDVERWRKEKTVWDEIEEKHDELTAKRSGRKGRLVIFAAPSGTGKSTIIRKLMKDGAPSMRFSVSATTRAPREGETDGVDYIFLTDAQFEERLKNGDFIETEEVYSGTRYGTLRQETDRMLDRGDDVIFDIDVNGALKIKEAYGSQALSIFIIPPSPEELRRRLETRGTETPESLEKRIDRAGYEMLRCGQFDRTIVNGDLDAAVEEVRGIVRKFLE